MPFEYFAHTGDIGVRVWADSVAALFESAVEALADAVTDPATVQARETIELSCRAPGLDLLLHDFLSDIVFHLDVDRLLASTAKVSITREIGHWLLRARVAGERIDPERHPVKVQVKAVTYHALQVEQAGDLWRATVVFDI